MFRNARRWWAEAGAPGSTMSGLLVRRLLIDLETLFARHWAGGDAFRSAWFNALSMSFPVGEQFFIDSVKLGLQAPPEAKREAMAADAGFHRAGGDAPRIHACSTASSNGKGHVNAWAVRATRRIERLKAWMLAPVTRRRPPSTSPRSSPSGCSRIPECLSGAEPRLRTLWTWHAAEEAEHRSIAFDLYAAAQVAASRGRCTASCAS